MKYPLTDFCVTFCLGIVVAPYLRIGFLIFYLLTFFFIILSVIFIKKNTPFIIFILCAFFFLGITLLKNSQTLPKSHIANMTSYQSKSICLVGVVDSDPIYNDRNVSFVLKSEKLKIDATWSNTIGKVLAKVFKNGEFSYGDRLLLEGKLYRPFSFSSEFNYRDYLRRQGIYSIVSVKKDNEAKKLGRNIGNPLKSFSFRIKYKVRDMFNKNLSSLSAAVFNAIILGERQNLPVYLNDALVKSGTVHIIAISGLNVGIVSFITLLILKIIRIPRRIRYLFIILFLIIYCILTGAKAPVLRATVMAIILLFGYFLEREVNIYNSLSVAALIILVVNPWQLFEVSFQLSFLSLIFIVWLTPKVKSLFSIRLQKITWLYFLILTFSVSAAAWIGILPLIAYYFKIVTPIALVANMFIVPYMTIITASAFVLAFFGILIPSLASIIAASNEFFILVLFKVNSLFISIPGAYFMLPRISFGCVLFYYVMLILIFNFSRISFMINYVRESFSK